MNALPIKVKMIHLYTGEARVFSFESNKAYSKWYEQHRNSDEPIWLHEEFVNELEPVTQDY